MTDVWVIAIRFRGSSHEVIWAIVSLLHFLAVSFWNVSILRHYYRKFDHHILLSFFHLEYSYTALINCTAEHKSIAEVLFSFQEVLYEIPFQALLQFYALQTFDSDTSSYDKYGFLSVPYISALISCFTFGYKIATINKDVKPEENIGFRKSEVSNFIEAARECVIFAMDMMIRNVTLILVMKLAAKMEILVLSALLICEVFAGYVYSFQDGSFSPSLSFFTQSFADGVMSLSTGVRILNYYRIHKNEEMYAPIAQFEFCGRLFFSAICSICWFLQTNHPEIRWCLLLVIGFSLLIPNYVWVLCETRNYDPPIWSFFPAKISRYHKNLKPSTKTVHLDGNDSENNV